MTTELKVTSPEEYAALAQQVSAADNVGFLHKLQKTGAVVRLRRMDMEALTMVGALPMSLVTAALGIAAKEQNEKRDPTPEETEENIKTLIFMRQAVVDNCLEPRISYEEGVGVFFVGSNGKPVSRVDKDDFMEMFAVISGEEGADGLDQFRNRKERRASASKSRRKNVRTAPEPHAWIGDSEPAVS